LNEGIDALRKYILSSAVLLLLALPQQLHAQEYSVAAIDLKSGKVLKGIPITLRYDCTATGTGIKTKIHCKFLQRKTETDGIAHFPEAGSLKGIDDIFSLPINYAMVCCDISKPVIPGTGSITFQRRSLGQTLHWIFIGD
jgi:hypothetical protein